MASESVATGSVANRFTIRTTVGYQFGKTQSCNAGDTLLCDRNKLPERGDMVVLIRDDGRALAWRCDVPPHAFQDGGYAFGFAKENGEIVFFRSSDFAECGVVIDSRPANA